MAKIALILLLILSASLFSNSLKEEESPYLQQHANNPVEWFAWSKEAFDKAKRENKLIFLSIGYSTCHWCHVMEQESFEDREIADILNKNYVAIKVDKEEYPEIDRYYQLVYQILNKRGGGWPLTIILTPEKEAFFASTYMPKESKFNQTGLKETLEFISKEWKSSPKRVINIAHKIKLYADEMRYRSTKLTPKKPDENISKIFVASAKRDFDKEFGGWGRGIKFPHANRVLTLLDIYAISKDEEALEIATKTLNSMALSGIYDQVEGGFFRYSTDRKWQIPHFEKMLYTNAELITAYARAYQLTKNILYKNVVEESIELFLKKYRDKSGLFYGASDADSLNPKSNKKEEGFYFVYGFDEVKQFLQKSGVDKRIIENGMKHYGFKESGNFSNFKTNPHIANSSGSCPILKKALNKLRTKRDYPFIDKKMQSSWNALMVSALFKASEIDIKFRDVAVTTLESIIKKLYLNGTLYHQILPEKTPKVEGGLEDYIFVVSALLDGYNQTLEKNYLKLAKELQDRAKELFFKDGVWIDNRKLFSTPLTIEDNSYKSALALLIDNYLRLAILYESMDYFNEAKRELYRVFEDIKHSLADSSTAVRATLAYELGYFLLKTDKKRLPQLQKRAKREIFYPFVEFKESKESSFQACKIDRCMILEKDISDFFQKLRREIK
jgi:uncharacterized protein YyaL (SSP411 family)